MMIAVRKFMVEVEEGRRDLGRVGIGVGREGK